MIAVYALAVLAGGAGVAAWALLVGFSAGAGSDRRDPERFAGRAGRLAISAVLGFGLGGMSASFAGWAGATTLLAALGGGLLLVVMGVVLGPDGNSTRERSG